MPTTTTIFSLGADGSITGNGGGITNLKVSPSDIASGGASSGDVLTWDGSAWGASAVSAGTVTSVDVSGGSTGLTTSGGPITTSGTITLAGTLALANGGTGATDATGARAALGLGDCATLDVGTGSGEVAAGDHTHTGVYQPLDATLTALAGVSTSANQIIYATGSDTFSTTTITAFGRSLIDDTDATTARGTLGLGDSATRNVGTTAGTVAAGDHSHSGYQPLDATLTALAGVSTSADKLIYATGSDTFTTTSLTVFGRSLIDDADATAARTTLGLGNSATLNTGTTAGTVATGDHTHSGYQAYSTTLQWLSDATPADYKISRFKARFDPYPTFVTGYEQFTLSDFAVTLIDDTSASSMRTTLELGTIATQNANAVAITGGAISGVTISGITDLAIADGGTGASTASGARTNLGLGNSATLNTGTTAGTVATGDHAHTGVYQPADATLTALSGLDTAGLINLIRQPGEIQAFAFGTTPVGNWLQCNGSAVSRTTYAALFAAIGTTWGSGNGSTTFNLPDLRRRTLVGSGGTSTGTLGNAVGSTGGTETHTLSVAEMPSHSHSGSGGGSLLQGGSGSAANLATGGGSYAFGATNAVGSGSPHNNLPPSAVVAYWIKY